MAEHADKSGKPFRSFRDYEWDLLRLVNWQDDSIHKEFLEIPMHTRIKFYRYLIKERREDLADIFENKYLIKMNLKGQEADDGLAERVRAEIGMSIRYLADLYLSYIKAQPLDDGDNKKIEHLLKLGKKERVILYRRLCMTNPDAANYFSRNFMFRKGTLDIPI